MRTRRRTNRREGGFTVMELLVTAGFVSVVGAVAVINLMASIPTMRLREGGRLMYLALQQAKMEAVKRNASVALELKTVSCGGAHTISSGSNFKLSYKVEEDEACGTSEKDGWCAITEAPVYLSDQVAMCTLSGNRNQENPEKIIFRANGQLVDLKEKAIRLKNSASREVCVNLNAAGGIRIKDLKQHDNTCIQQ